jgi:hypothetical protein
LSCDVLCSPQSKLDLGTRRFLRLFHERTNYDDPAADRGDLKRTGNSIAASQPQLPQLSLKVLHMRFAQALQPGRSNTFGKPDKPRLHVGRKRGDLCSDSFVEDFDSPRHDPSYISILR